MFQRDCGATTGFSTQVSVLKAGEELFGSGNTFVADTDYGAATASDWGGPWAEIEWVTSNRLRVRYAVNSRIFEQDKRVSGVKISYQ